MQPDQNYKKKMKRIKKRMMVKLKREKKKKKEKTFGLIQGLLLIRKDS